MKSIISAKKKKERQYGVIWGAPNSSVAKREYAPGQHGQRRKKPTDYGTQLYAKQKLKTYYGNVSEKQFHKYYVEAIRRSGDAAENLIGILESRLDNLVYKAKFVPTIFAARQFVNHGHVTVNGKKVNIPSYMVKAGDVIEVTSKAKQMPVVIAAMESFFDVQTGIAYEKDKKIGIYYYDKENSVHTFPEIEDNYEKMIAGCGILDSSEIQKNVNKLFAPFYSNEKQNNHNNL
ncbi:MAG: 30S ribosomal protein S4 [Alphaproteobacteria bacterium]|nr:30S ribosomal protein S4 [Alphaproteobacteria bacterium]